jgi:hypothetical protein
VINSIYSGQELFSNSHVCKLQIKKFYNIAS